MLKTNEIKVVNYKPLFESLPQYFIFVPLNYQDQ
ncbi:MAG: hypothetical protein ACI9HJ_000564 [Ulvibacter sp.]